MTAYAIGLYDVWDWSWHKQYRDPVTKLIEKHGGKYLVRGGDLEVKEGEWQPNRLVVLLSVTIICEETMRNTNAREQNWRV